MKRLFNRVEWNLGLVVNGTAASFLQTDFVPSIRWFDPPRYGTFLADPFVFEYGQRTAVLCERFEYMKGKAHIAALEIAGDKVIDCGPAIETPYHLSYPCVFEWNRGIFCVPESRESGGADIYRMTDFPSRWEHVARILDEPIVDPTIFASGGTWWMLGTLRPHENETISLWHAQAPVGPWTAHPRNPLRTDRRSARPAGRPFEHNGVMYRPAQDCTSAYGQAVTINRIDELTTKDFHEQPVATAAAAEPYALGMHTLNSTGRHSIIDGRRDVFAIDKVLGSAIRASHLRSVSKKA